MRAQSAGFVYKVLTIKAGRNKDGQHTSIVINKDLIPVRLNADALITPLAKLQENHDCFIFFLPPTSALGRM